MQMFLRDLRFALLALIQDARFSLRILRKSPGFAVVMILTLALGIGATTAIFAVVDGVVLKPLVYSHPEQLVSVEISPLALDPSLRGIAPEDYFVFREQNRTFQQMGIYAETDTDRDVNVTSFGQPERVHALNVTHDVLSTLAVRPMIGRVFLPSDDSPRPARHRDFDLRLLATAFQWRRFSARQNDHRRRKGSRDHWCHATRFPLSRRS